MPFKRILHELVKAVPGARGAILADWEGEAVAQFTHDDEFEMKIVGAHKGIILSQLRDIHGKVGFTEPAVVEISTEAGTVLVAGVGADYCVVMTLAPAALRSKAAYMLNNSVNLLIKEIY